MKTRIKSNKQSRHYEVLDVQAVLRLRGAIAIIQPRKDGWVSIGVYQTTGSATFSGEPTNEKAIRASLRHAADFRKRAYYQASLKECMRRLVNAL